MPSVLNVGSTYDAVAVSKELGFQDLDLTGVTQLVFRVKFNKIGTGTLSWQLWNETDGTELALITDAAAAADNKNLSTTVAVNLTGIKTVRVRCKSTVATDDPYYYGSSVMLVKP